MSDKGLFKPSKRGKTIKSGVRKNILNVYSQLREINPQDSTNQLVEKVAQLTGVSKRTIYRLRKEEKEPAALTTPGKRRPNAVGKRTRLEKYDSFVLSSIRRKVHDFFRRNELPNLDKVLKVLGEDGDIFEKNVSRATLYRILKDLGFSYAKKKRNAVLMEKPDVVLCRRNYLRKIKEYKKKNMPIYYLDQTCVIEGQDEGSSSNSEPKGKGRKLIFTHIGSVKGFVPDALDLFMCKKLFDEMDANHFERWLETVVPRLQPESVIVMDNAPYHSAKVEEVPTSSWKKCAIQQWLSLKKVNFSPDMIKVELLQKVSEVKSSYDKQRVEEMAEKYGHVVLRLPPHHGELNAIEMIWCQVKERVARRNRTSRLNDVSDLMVQCVKSVTREDWIDCVNHVTLEEDAMWELDGLVDEICENQNFIMTVNRSSSSSDSESMSADEVIPEDIFEKEKAGDPFLEDEAAPTSLPFPEQKRQRRKKNNPSPVQVQVRGPSKRKFSADDISKVSMESATKARSVLKTTETQPMNNSPDDDHRPIILLNLMTTAVTSLDGAVALSPSTLITPDVDDPPSASASSSRTSVVEHKSGTMLEPLITIKEEPIDPYVYE